MTITNGYATLDEFKAYAMPDTGTDSADDAVIESIIEGASRQIDTFCGRFFYQSTTTKYYISNDGEYLNTHDIYTATGLTIEVDLNADGIYETTFTSNDYNLTPYSPEPFPYFGIEATFRNGISFSRSKKGNKITASFGWSAVPDDIRQACLIASSIDYKRRFGDGTGSVATITGAGVVLSPSGLPVAATQKLMPYRKIF